MRAKFEAIGILGAKNQIVKFLDWVLTGNKKVSFMKCAKHFFGVLSDKPPWFGNQTTDSYQKPMLASGEV